MRRFLFSFLERQVLSSLLAAASAITLPAQTFTELANLDGSFYPYGGLVQALDGEFYGTTSEGGVNCAPYGCGTVFKITPSGSLSTVYNFCSQSGCADGRSPYSTLVQSPTGELFGTTTAGGVNGSGVVFKLTPGGILTTLYSFCSQPSCADGANPTAGLVQAANGAFYGTTYNGGVQNFSCKLGCGTVFQITPDGVFTTLHSFCSEAGCPDGTNPNASLIQATDFNLYGTTLGGNQSASNGTVFKITPGGALTTLYNFCADGSENCAFEPYGALVQGAGGDFFGTTASGGKRAGGTVFKLTPGGSLTTLHNFCYEGIEGCTGGDRPEAGLVHATDGDFYGTTYYGGANFGGTIFGITPSGAFTTLFSFLQSSTTGEYPRAALIQSTNGIFYGTASAESIFSLSNGLEPFVEAQTGSGLVGSIVNILGTNLTGAISVTFNGTAASFETISSSEIQATVPVGASTGTVAVTTPGGMLLSNGPFRVLP